MGRLPGYRTGSLSRNRQWSLRRWFNRWNSRGDGFLRPQVCVPPTGVLRRRRDRVEGGGGTRRARLECSAGEWGAATAAPFFRSVTRKYAAVAIAMPSKCCEAVSALEGAKILATRAPKLPLSNCSMPNECRCRFQKYMDRREDDQGRRFRYGQERSAWYAGSQRRKSRGRRTAD